MSHPGLQRSSGYLIDTTVISELRRREPEPRVEAWFEQRPAVQLYLSVLTLGEIRLGVERMAAGERQQALRTWLEAELPAFFSGRLLPVDEAVAQRWGRLVAEMGRPLPAIDSLMAATALEHNLVLVTRNLKDVADLPVMVANPLVASGGKPVVMTPEAKKALSSTIRGLLSGDNEVGRRPT